MNEEKKLTGYPSEDKPWDKRKTELNIPDVNLYDFLIHRSRLNASSILSRCLENELTIPLLKVDTLAYAKGFAKSGINKGDIVPICLPMSNVGIILFFALNRIGAVATFLNHTASKEELNTCLQRFKAKILIVSNDRISDIERGINPKAKLVVVGERPTEMAGYTSLLQIASDGKNYDLPLMRGSKNDDAFICFTSGTTGKQKAIVLTNENIMASILAMKKTTHMQFGPLGNCMCVVPFNYPYGFLTSTLFPMYVGKTVALTPGMRLDNISDYLERYKPRYIQATPSFYKAMIKDEKLKGKSLRYLKYQVSGGDTLDIESKKAIQRFNVLHYCHAKICDGSGSGEGCGCLTTSVVLGKSNWDSVGKPLKGLNVKIVSHDTGEKLKYDEPGILCFSGKMIMHHYYEDEQGTNAVLKKENGETWLHTDTFAHIDKDGWLYIDGRERRFFITYDENGSPYKVYGDRVQSVIKESKYVDDCVVIRKADKIRGFSPVAFVVSSGKGDWKTDAMFLCRQKLDNCAIPVEWIEIDRIPLTEAGKTDYLALEKMMDE